jgi:hypothetical protein
MSPVIASVRVVGAGAQAASHLSVLGLRNLTGLLPTITLRHVAVN